MLYSRVVVWFCAGVMLAVGQALRAAEPTLLTLTNLAQIHALEPSMASNAIPVRLEAMVTFHSRDSYLTFLRDDTGAGYLLLNHQVRSYPNLVPGDIVEVSGVSAAGGFLPIITDPPSGVARLEHKRNAPLPPGLKVDLNRLVNDPGLDCQWVEVELDVDHVFLQAPFAALELAASVGTLRALIPGYTNSTSLPWDLAGRRISARGAVATFHNGQRQMTGRTLCIPSMAEVRVLDAQLLDDFSIPLRPIRSVLTPGSLDMTHPVVRVRGVVTYCLPNEHLCVQDDTSGIWIKSAQPCEELMVGDAIEVVGRPLPRALKPTLVQSRFRARGRASVPRPTPLGLTEFLSGTHHANLVSMEGEVADVRHEPMSLRLMLRVEGGLILAEMAELADHAGTTDPQALLTGSRVRLTGVCHRDPGMRFGVSVLPREVLLRLRDRSDIQLLAAPPRFTLRQLAAALAVVVAIALIAAGWGISLRRRVAVQSVLIHEQLSLATRKEERLRIAGDLHDSLQQHLVGLGMQMRTVLDQLDTKPDQARRNLELADRMLRHSQEEAHHSIWNLRHQSATPRPAAEVLRRVLDPIQLAAPDRVLLEVIPPDLVLPAHLEQSVSRIVQESVTNAARHAGDVPIHVHLSAEAHRLTLRIRDEGRGFDPAAILGEGRITLGLAGMRERAHRIGGELTIDSQPGQGTTVTLLAPMLHT